MEDTARSCILSGPDKAQIKNVFKDACRKAKEEAKSKAEEAGEVCHER